MPPRPRATAPALRRRALAAVSLTFAGALALSACCSSDDDSGSKSVAQGGKDFGKAAEETARMGTDARSG